MDMHYCEIFTECYHCPIPFCPYEKLEDWGQSGWEEEPVDDQEEDDEEEGW